MSGEAKFIVIANGYCPMCGAGRILVFDKNGVDMIKCEEGCWMREDPGAFFTSITERGLKIPFSS